MLQGVASVSAASHPGPGSSEVVGFSGLLSMGFQGGFVAMRWDDKCEDKILSVGAGVIRSFDHRQELGESCQGKHQPDDR